MIATGTSMTKTQNEKIAVRIGPGDLSAELRHAFGDDLLVEGDPLDGSPVEPGIVDCAGRFDGAAQVSISGWADLVRPRAGTRRSNMWSRLMTISTPPDS